MKLRRQKWSSFLIVFFSCALIVFFIPSCGFWSGENADFSVDSGRSGPGDGDTPTLGPRLNETPDLADKECEDNDRCEEACRRIYEDSDSYRECYKLTIGEVSKIEDVFYALLGEDVEDLEDIDKEDLENYVKVGLDGWRDKVVKEQKKEEADRNERFQTVLHWIVDIENEVIPILETEDQDNEILEELFLGHCDRRDNNICQNDVSPLVTSCGADLSFDYTSGYVCADSKKIAFIEEEENKQLFLALISGGNNFFKRAAGNRRYSAFILGNKLVEQACSNRNETSFNQCVAAFYCHLHDDDHLNQFFFLRDDMTEGVGRSIFLMNCNNDYSIFEDII